MTAPTREHYLLVVEQALRTISAAERALPVEVGPGSTVADIADWAARFATAATDQLSSTALAARPPGQDPAALAVAGPELLSALATTPMRRPCWTPSPAVAPQAAFWLRRSAHALSVRAWQVQVATDQPAVLEPWLLLDGIDEHLRVMLAVAAGDAQTPTGRARGSIAVRCTRPQLDGAVRAGMCAAARRGRAARCDAGSGCGHVAARPGRDVAVAGGLGGGGSACCGAPAITTEASSWWLVSPAGGPQHCVHAVDSRHPVPNP